MLDLDFCSEFSRELAEAWVSCIKQMDQKSMQKTAFVPGEAVKQGQGPGGPAGGAPAAPPPPPGGAPGEAPPGGADLAGLLGGMPAPDMGAMPGAGAPPGGAPVPPPPPPPPPSDTGSEGGEGGSETVKRVSNQTLYMELVKVRKLLLGLFKTLNIPIPPEVLEDEDQIIGQKKPTGGEGGGGETAGGAGEGGEAMPPPVPPLPGGGEQSIADLLGVTGAGAGAGGEAPPELGQKTAEDLIKQAVMLAIGRMASKRLGLA